MNRLFLLLTLLIFAPFALLPAYAQETQPISFGEPVFVSFTVPSQEAQFEFTGSADDVIAVSIKSTSLLPKPFVPELQLTGPNGFETSVGMWVMLKGALVTILPADGRYKVRVKSAPAVLDEEYIVRLLPVVELTVDMPLEDTFSTESGSRYYLIRQTGEPLTLRYQKSEGAAIPDLVINPLPLDDTNPFDLITLAGSLSDVQVVLPTGHDTLILSIGMWLPNFDGTEKRATYTLTLS
jgi:hypothetical protein